MARIEGIGILTSGGGCSGLNGVIRAVVHRAIEGYRSLGRDALIGVGGDA